MENGGDRRSDFLTENQTAIQDEFVNWANKNQSFGSLLTVEPSNPLRKQYVDLSVSHYEPFKVEETTQGHDFTKSRLNRLCECMVGPGVYQSLVDSFNHRGDVLKNIKLALSVGKKIAILNNHHWLLSPAAVQIGLYGSVDQPELAQHSAIIVNKMLGFQDIILERDLNVQPIVHRPAIAALQEIGHVFCSVPRTSNGEIFADYADKLNLKMLKEFIKFANSSNGLLLIVSPTGTKDRDNKKGTIAMPRVGDTTAKLLGGFDLALPVVAWLDPIAKAISLDIGEMRPVNDSNDIHQAMADMQAPYGRLASQHYGQAVTVQYS